MYNLYSPSKYSKISAYKEANTLTSEKGVYSCIDTSLTSLWVEEETNKKIEVYKKEYERLSSEIKKKEATCVEYLNSIKSYVDKVIQHIKDIDYTTTTIRGQEVRYLQVFYHHDYNYEHMCKFYIVGYILCSDNSEYYNEWDIYGKDTRPFQHNDLILTI